MRRVLRPTQEEPYNSRGQHGADVLLFHEMGSIVYGIGTITEKSAPGAKADHAAFAIMVASTEKGQRHIIAAVSSKSRQSFFPVTAVFA